MTKYFLLIIYLHIIQSVSFLFRTPKFILKRKPKQAVITFEIKHPFQKLFGDRKIIDNDKSISIFEDIEFKRVSNSSSIDTVV